MIKTVCPACAEVFQFRPHKAEFGLIEVKMKKYARKILSFTYISPCCGANLYYDNKRQRLQVK